MAKYNGPVCRLCRREGQKLFLKGERCITDKCSFERREYAPGMHGAKRPKLSEFGTQMREKQKVKRVYGMMEKPFRTLFEKASKGKGVVSDVFFGKLELRLDNVVYRAGLARSRQDAKQVVRHNHILVNGKRCNIPSAGLSIGDTVSLSTKGSALDRSKQSELLFQKRPTLSWLQVDRSNSLAKVVAQPTREDVGMPIKERLIVELYSK